MRQNCGVEVHSWSNLVRFVCCAWHYPSSLGNGLGTEKLSMCCLITCTCLYKNSLCSNYGSGANHHAWGFIMLQFPFIFQSSPRAAFWLMITPIQHKINWFHSRRLEMVGNIIPPYSWQKCVCYSELAEYKQEKEENRFFLQQSWSFISKLA